MRIDHCKVITLEEDIKALWKQHGWRITKETVTKDGMWIISAKRITKQRRS